MGKVGRKLKAVREGAANSPERATSPKLPAPKVRRPSAPGNARGAGPIISPP
jgi:hypothetical protein